MKKIIMKPRNITHKKQLCRRRLLCEGHALLKYVLNENPSAALIKRYFFAIQYVQNASPLHLPNVMLTFPKLLTVLDNTPLAKNTLGKAFKIRLDIATYVAEAEPNNFMLFNTQQNSYAKPMLALFGIIKAIMRELFWRIVVTLSFPFCWFYFKNKKP